MTFAVQNLHNEPAFAVQSTTFSLCSTLQHITPIGVTYLRLCFQEGSLSE